MSTNDAPAALAEPPAATPAPKEDRLARFRAPLADLRREVGRVYIGPESVTEALLVALLADGHVLLEGVPGVAKTTLVRAFAKTIDATFKRVQFTPDLLPSDVTGVYVPNLQTNEFVFRKGPIFTNVLLGDEINRAPAKTQAALLEAMQERQVTVEGATHPLDGPFIVLATQNPIEQEGVYALPEAQLDRFLLKLDMDYPSMDQEIDVLKTHHQPVRPVKAVLNGADVMAIREIVRDVHVSDELAAYIVRLTRFTREHGQVALGASPRAGLALLRAAKARAVLYDRDFILPDDIKAMAGIVLAHRVLLSPEAELGGLTSREVVRQAVSKVRYSA